MPVTSTPTRSRVVACVHDELLVEVPEEHAHECARRIEELMIKGMSEYVPDIPIQAEPALMRRWRKGADPVVGADGRLICWEDRVLSNKDVDTMKEVMKNTGKIWAAAVAGGVEIERAREVLGE